MSVEPPGVQSRMLPLPVSCTPPSELRKAQPREAVSSDRSGAAETDKFGSRQPLSGHRAFHLGTPYPLAQYALGVDSGASCASVSADDYTVPAAHASEL